MGERVTAVRGAIRVDQDQPDRVLDATERLLGALLERNRIGHDDLIAIFFTATPDLVSTFPAAAARRMGFGDVALMCAQEIPVSGSLERVVRVMVTFRGDGSPPAPVYLDGAEVLRDDIV